MQQSKLLQKSYLKISNDGIADHDQRQLLNELRRFLSHESAGVKGFERMPPEWAALNRLVSSGGAIPAKSTDAAIVLDGWHQETRDLSLILSRLTETGVSERLPKKHRNDPILRHKDELITLRESHCLTTTLDVPNAAAPIEIIADITRRSVDVGMTLRAPADKRSSKARINWLLRQIKTTESENIHVRLQWPGSSPITQYSLNQLREDVGIVEKDKGNLQVTGFHVFLSNRLGPRFAQQANFIVDLENAVPEFYSKVGASLTAWKKSAPQLKTDRATAGDVSVDAISEDANSFDE